MGKPDPGRPPDGERGIVKSRRERAGRDRQPNRPSSGGPAAGRPEPRKEWRDRDAMHDERDAIVAKLTGGIPAPFEVLYGMNPIREALLAGRRKFRRLYVARREDSPEMTSLLALAKQHGLEPVQVERDSLDALVTGDAESAQGIGLAATPYRYYSLEELAGPTPEAPALPRRRLLALDEIEDPRNLGAMARTAEAGGFRGMIVQEHRAASATPTAVKASAGALEHLRLARETNLSDALTRLKEHGYWIVGLESDDPGAKDIYKLDLDMDICLVIGAEGKGLRPRVKSCCDLLVRLPMAGKVGSLNASAATAAAVYQVLRADAVRD